MFLNKFLDRGIIKIFTLTQAPYLGHSLQWEQILMPHGQIFVLANFRTQL